MANSTVDSSIDRYFAKHEKWEDALRNLRAIALSCGLTEEMKWGWPCYTLNGKNVVLIHVFKDYFAFLFFKGALLKDEKSILIQQTKTVQAARQIRFANDAQVTAQKRTIKAYILDAMDVDKSGLKVELKKTAEFEMPEEFKLKLAEMPTLKKAFLALTPGRQRAYLLHFSAAKESKTRETRVVKCAERILQGKGLDDL
jgi:uncharacterized protein YdeI (YjbR/CyaY-like superfamily)